MTRRNLVRTITEECGLQQIQVTRIVKKIFESIVDALIEDGRVELRNFGVFEVRHRKARNGRNLHTGKELMIPEHYTVIFKPGNAMELRINEECRIETAGREVPE